MLYIQEKDWLDYIFESVSVMSDNSTKGFAFDFLSSAVDDKNLRDRLYYAEADKVRKYCLDKLLKDVAVIRGYGLFDFTVQVRKPE